MRILRRRRKPREGIDKLDAAEKKKLREQKRKKRKENRQARWLFLSTLLGNIGGTMLGTKKVGLVLTAGVALAVAIAIWRFLL